MRSNAAIKPRRSRRPRQSDRALRFLRSWSATALRYAAGRRALPGGIAEVRDAIAAGGRGFALLEGGIIAPAFVSPVDQAVLIIDLRPGFRSRVQDPREGEDRRHHE